MVQAQQHQDGPPVFNTHTGGWNVAFLIDCWSVIFSQSTFMSVVFNRLYEMYLNVDVCDLRMKFINSIMYLYMSVLLITS